MEPLSILEFTELDVRTIVSNSIGSFMPTQLHTFCMFLKSLLHTHMLFCHHTDLALMLSVHKAFEVFCWFPVKLDFCCINSNRIVVMIMKMIVIITLFYYPLLPELRVLVSLLESLPAVID